MTRRNDISLALAGALLIFSAAQAARAAAPPVMLHLTGFVADTAHVTARGATAPIDVWLEGWTTDDDLARFADVLTTKGSTVAANSLFAGELGRVRIDGRLGNPIRIARATPTPDGGRDVVLVVDRPLRPFEVWRAARSFDYRYTVVELHLGPNGRGSGTLTAAAKPDPSDRDNVAFQALGRFPLRVFAVRTESKS